MTRKATFGIAIPAVAVVVMLLPNPVIDAVYYHGYGHTYLLGTVAKWIVPITVVVISFLLLADWIKSLIAGGISLGFNMLMLGIIGIGGLDCGGDVTHLSRACGSGAVIGVKIGLAGMICLNLFLLWRIAYPKPPKTPKAVQTK